MPTPVSSIRNLGPASDAVYARAGIGSAEELRALGADEAYLRLLKSGSRPHFIAYYAMVMGLQGRPWNDAKGEEKKALRQRFDALKRKADQHDPEAAPGSVPPTLDRMLREVGVAPSKPAP